MTHDPFGADPPSAKDALYQRVSERFRREFPHVQQVLIARAPGRVNLIGEHTDYNGLPVLPLAIDREIAVAFSPSDLPEVELVNVDGSYRQVRFAISESIPAEEIGSWGNYIRAAAQELWLWAKSCESQSLPLRGFVACVGGNIPPGAGLSSSSALVVAAGLILAYLNRLPISKLELAELLARGERYVGTEGGGMDHAASLLGEAGCALRIDFYPLSVRPVPLPSGCSVIIANSMVTADKTGTARIAFNTRVAECRLGLVMLKKAVSGFTELKKARLLKDFVRIVPEWKPAVDLLPDGPLTLTEAASFAGLTEEELTDTCLRRKDGEIIPVPLNGFQPKRRVRHVLSEFERVEMALKACLEGDAGELGTLMDASHESCANDYEVSCPELDFLVDVLRKRGALGARLTGAGFGGCAVALVPSDSTAETIQAVWRDYYLGFLSGRNAPVPEVRDEAIFAVEASAGACVMV